jgi:hypothetical protein
MLKMEVTSEYSSERSVEFQRTTWHYNPYDFILVNGRHRRKALGVNGKIILKLMVKDKSMRVCTRFIGLRTATSSGLL